MLLYKFSFSDTGKYNLLLLVAQSSVQSHKEGIPSLTLELL